MAKTTLKIVDRKTTVPRESFRKAFAGVLGKNAKPVVRPFGETEEEIAKKASKRKSLS